MWPLPSLFTQNSVLKTDKKALQCLPSWYTRQTLCFNKLFNHFENTRIRHTCWCLLYSAHEVVQVSLTVYQLIVVQQSLLMYLCHAFLLKTRIRMSFSTTPLFLLWYTNRAHTFHRLSPPGTLGDLERLEKHTCRSVERVFNPKIGIAHLTSAKFLSVPQTWVIKLIQNTSHVFESLTTFSYAPSSVFAR